MDRLLDQCNRGRQAEISAEMDTEQAVRCSQIIITVTPSYEPLIRAEWVQSGTHISCVDADLSGKQEVDAKLFAKALIFGDDIQQCLSVGECEIPFKAGVISGLDAEIGAVLTGKHPGRTSQTEITIFDSTGIALQDISSAGMILNSAEDLGLGVVVDF